MKTAIKWWTSRNSRGHWSRDNYRYGVGQRVVVDGKLGTVVAPLPEKRGDYLWVVRDGVAAEQEKPGGWYGGSSVVPLRKFLERRIRNRRVLIDSDRQWLARLDELGNEEEVDK